MTKAQARRQVAAAAKRAGGDRQGRRHRTTPLLADRDAGTPGSSAMPDPVPAAERVSADGVSAAGVSAGGAGGAGTEAGAMNGAAVEVPAEAAVPAEGTDSPGAPAVAVPEAGGAETAIPAVPAPRETPARAGPRRRPTVRAAAIATHGVARVRAGASRRTPGGERLVALADAAGRTGEALADVLESGTAGESALEQKITAILAFLRRRLTGDYEVDEFGFDPDLTDSVLLNLFRPLYRHWFRVEVRGIENIPETGGALLVANHSGAIALDSLMTQIAIHDEHPRHRHLRMLGADLVFSAPLLGEFARKGGATLASNADAERLLSGGELVGVWPEGFKGIGKPFTERYKLQRFGRGGFVSAALKTRTPIVPCAIVGAEETYPIIGDLPAVARMLGLPYMPVTPTWPLLGLLGMIPLPSKWLIEFGAPLPTDELGPGQADDPMVVFDLTDQVRQSIQQTLYSLLVQRRSVFF
jgi:1-acyl-sn-glycerol-3-phosphate acyltransferase